MLLNFCHSCLKPEVTCSTVSTDGYDIKNLISCSDSGFMAYSCIKPPVNIDFTFMCDIQISRVIIWPSVGSQKSSGFQLLAKSMTDNATYVMLSTGYLNEHEVGVFFYRRDLVETKVVAPPGFLSRFMKINNPQVVNKTNNLRISIVKTDNSVPAISKIEVWGRVSRSCGKDVVAGVNALWMYEHSPPILSNNMIEETLSVNQEKTTVAPKFPVLDIPEEFSDPLTYEVMIQPIILPCGKIIDQRTLERQEQSDALWGRLPSDPFTGIPFSTTCRPVIATALKARIDKFLLENSHRDEIKKLPRTTGCKMNVVPYDKISGLPEIPSKNDGFRNKLSTVPRKSNYALKRKHEQQVKKHQHKLPVTLMCSIPLAGSSEYRLPKVQRTENRATILNNPEIENNCPTNIVTKFDNDLELNIKSVLSGLKRFSTPESSDQNIVQKNCSCCTNGILYQLPCSHIICRKVLTSTDNFICQFCSTPFQTSDPKRIHT